MERVASFVTYCLDCVDNHVFGHNTWWLNSRCNSPPPPPQNRPPPANDHSRWQPTLPTGNSTLVTPRWLPHPTSRAEVQKALASSLSLFCASSDSKLNTTVLGIMLSTRYGYGLGVHSQGRERASPRHSFQHTIR